MASEINQDVVDIVHNHAADRWMAFGRALLRSDTAKVRDITSRLGTSDPTAPRGNFEKLRRVLEAWIEGRGGIPTRDQLRKACSAENVLGGVEMTYYESYGKKAGTKAAGNVRNAVESI